MSAHTLLSEYCKWKQQTVIYKRKSQPATRPDTSLNLVLVTQLKFIERGPGNAKHHNLKRSFSSVPAPLSTLIHPLLSIRAPLVSWASPPFFLKTFYMLLHLPLLFMSHLTDPASQQANQLHHLLPSCLSQQKT